VDLTLDLKVNEGESTASIIRDLTSGMAEGDADQSRIIRFVAREVEDAQQETTEARGCGCMDVIG
jgi:hypothetical protein